MLFFVFAPYFGAFRLFFQLFSSLNVFKDNQKELKISSQISKKSNDRFGLKQQRVGKEKQNNEKTATSFQTPIYNILITKRLQIHSKTYMFHHPKHICFTLSKLNFEPATNP